MFVVLSANPIGVCNSLLTLFPCTPQTKDSSVLLGETENLCSIARTEISSSTGLFSSTSVLSCYSASATGCFTQGR